MAVGIFSPCHLFGRQLVILSIVQQQLMPESCGSIESPRVNSHCSVERARVRREFQAIDSARASKIHIAA